MADHTPGDELTLEPTTVVTRPRRRALWGVLAAVAVAAGALAVTSGGDDDEQPVLPVALGAASGRDSAAGEAAPTTADMRIGWITYVAGDGLPALGGEGTAYRLAGSVDEGRVRALADELGLQGDLTHQDRYWHLEGDAGILEVYDDGGGSWWYSQSVGDVSSGSSSGGGSSGSSSGGGSAGCEGGPAVDCAVDTPLTVDTATTIPADECAKLGTDCATAPATAECGPNAECIDPMPPECAPDAECVVPPPIEPTPPADLPTKEAARQIALDLLTATGMDVDGAKITVDGPYDAWYVTVEPILDGVPVSGWLASVGVGSKGVVTSASGTLGEPESLGDYPLIDTRAAIDRLNDQQGQYGYPMPLGVADASSAGAAESSCSTQPDGSEVCSSTGTAVACAGEAVAPASDDGVATTIITPCPEPAPTPVDPEPIEVTLRDAERVLVLLPSLDESGDAYLLPGYRFTGADGAMAEVAAVADESLAPTTTVPATDPTDTTVCEVLVEDDGSGTTHTVNPCPDEIQPSQPDLTHLSDGEQPKVGVAYYVDLTVMTGHCSWVSAKVGDRWWIAQLSNEELASWSTPTEGGAFTLIDEERAEFVGDAAGTKVASLTPMDREPLCG